MNNNDKGNNNKSEPYGRATGEFLSRNQREDSTARRRLPTNSVRVKNIDRLRKFEILNLLYF